MDRDWENIYVFLWRPYFKPRIAKITHQVLSQEMADQERNHAISLDPKLVARFREVNIHFSMDKDMFGNPALKQGVVIWLQRLWDALPSKSQQRRRLVLEWTYNCDDPPFRYDWYILRVRHPSGLQWFTTAAFESCFKELLLAWRDCHVGITQMVKSLGDGPAGVEVVVRNVSEIDGFRFGCEEDGGKIEGRFVDTKLDKRLCSDINDGRFTFLGKDLTELRCNYW